MNIMRERKQMLAYSLYDEDVALDVLLEMCIEKKVEIREIFVSNITAEFIKYVENLHEKDRDYDEIASFLVLASKLIEIKSRELLPNLDFEEIHVDIDLEKEMLFLRAEEYSLLKKSAQKLAQLEILNRFYKAPEYKEKDYITVIEDSTIEKMINAFKQLLEDAEIEKDIKLSEKVIEKERFTVADRVRFILEHVKAKKSILFSNLFDNSFSKIEKINTFLALLELAKFNLIELEQESKEIRINLSETTDSTMKIKEENLVKNIDTY